MMRNEILKDIRNGKVSKIIFDFDYTLTSKNSNSSIGVFSNYLPKTYYRKKRFLDFLTTIAFSKWFYKIIWKLKLKLLSLYFEKDLINKIDIVSEFKPNKIIIDILKNAVENNIDVLIYSSGLEEIILKFLEINSINKNSVRIIANKLNHADSSKIITPKKEKLSFKQERNIILIGDKKDDLKIVNNATKILLKNDELIEV